ncbi:sigma factor G inhibitor Gin [Anaerobranca gottschalkii]|uniref:Inhibitor of sigma-G Gin n=1 Tax=Anaerobranca gottschalkii DSM 13577 TaxID=1120990 RepID=A0A1I0BEQ3_9FIRM|nr:sigma factor G inhibitor Gin [Anaerobranca gottschalkii]SET05035.1 Inhibitor of sigma-G Gin [Anaerobranca gottschalkii DSM 13577]
MKICSLCNAHDQKGINILQSFLCDNCLERISKTGVDDPDYDKIVDGIKKVWQTNESVK